MSKAGRGRGQSAMEYLMTYGWAILVIAIVLGVLYYFGVFSGPSLSNSCLPSPGYLCTNPTMNSTGYLSIDFAVSGSAITLHGINCTSNSSQPAFFQPLTATQLQGGNIAYITMRCFGNAAGPVGHKYSGYIWINYSTPTQNSLYNRIAIVESTVASASSLPSSSLVTTTIPYTWGSSTQGNSLSLAPGYSGYICDAANYNAVISSPSWAVDTNTLYSSIGRQSSQTCTSTGTPASQAMAGIAVGTSLTPTILSLAECTSGCYGGAGSPSVAKNGTLGFFVFSCGGGSESCQFSTLPSGCTTLVNQVGSATYGGTLIVVCPSLQAGYAEFGWSGGGGSQIAGELYLYHN